MLKKTINVICCSCSKEQKIKHHFKGKSFNIFILSCNLRFMNITIQKTVSPIFCSLGFCFGSFLDPIINRCCKSSSGATSTSIKLFSWKIFLVGLLSVTTAGIVIGQLIKNIFFPTLVFKEPQLFLHHCHLEEMKELPQSQQ